MAISFLGVRRQTDTVLESSHENMSAHKKFQLKAQKLVVSCRSLYIYIYASPEDGDALISAKLLNSLNNNIVQKEIMQSSHISLPMIKIVSIDELILIVLKYPKS